MQPFQRGTFHKPLRDPAAQMMAVCQIKSYGNDKADKQRQKQTDRPCHRIEFTKQRIQRDLACLVITKGQ